MSRSYLHGLSKSLRGAFVLAGALSAIQASSVFAQVPSIPQEAYGPYNAVFLPDGPGLRKDLTAPTPIDGRTRMLLKRFGLDNGAESHDLFLSGAVPWTLTFWFHSTERLKGAVLIAGIGDPTAEDARFIGTEDNRLGLWMGTSTKGRHLLAAEVPLSGSAWHFAALVGNGGTLTLYVNGKPVVTETQAAGGVPARLEMAPEAVTGVTDHHFGGKICALRIFREALSAAQIEALSAAPPDFELPTYEEASKHWPVQISAQAGYDAPQDPSTYPRGRGGIQKPTARPLNSANLQTRLIGENPWTLTGGWRLQAVPEVKATGDDISKPGFPANDWFVATVPGTVLTTLIERGVYPDPDYGLNNLAIPESLAHQDYWYRVQFRVPAQARGRRLTLTFNGVNYAAEVWLNGKKLGTITGAFLRGTFDVTSMVSASGENALALRVSPPPHPGIAHEQSIKAGPGENGGVEVLDGPTFAATEGWDWVPGIRDRNTGLWQDVTLTATGNVEIGDLNVITTLPKPDISEADVEIEVPLTNTANTPVEGDLIVSFDQVRVTRHVKLGIGENLIHLEPAEYRQLRVQHPKLWWPNGYGAPNLHTLKATFAEAGKISSERQIYFGMREVSYEISLLDQIGRLRRMEIMPSRTYDTQPALVDDSHQGIREIDDRSPNLMSLGQMLPESIRHTWVQTLMPGADKSPSVQPVVGDWLGTDLVIKVNGVRVAARGGNWGMDDSRKRVSVEHLEPFFRLHRDAHLNIIRNWMGQNTEESFYALADKYGLMVWNDFWDSTQNYNLEAEDPQLFLENARDTILRFRYHPSIVVWCGRNEGVPQPIINEGLADLVRTLDHTRYYTGSSNRVNLRNSGPYQYQPLSTYYRINRGFSVELGIPSVPTLESLKSFIPEADRWPISDTWAYHDWHQSGNGAVVPYMQHMETEFGAPTSLEDFVRKAQMLDYGGHRAIFEGFAAHLWQPNSGRLIWMTQPAWPSMEWNFLSWDYDTQSSFYATQKACETVHAQLNLENDEVDLINLGAARSFKVETRVVGLDGKVLSDQETQVQAAADARTVVGKPDLEQLAAGRTIFVVLYVRKTDDTPVSNNFYWWSKEEATLRELDDLPKVKLQAMATWAAAGDERRITVKIKNWGPAPAVLAKLTLKDTRTGERILPAYFSENYFSLLPGESRTITIDTLVVRGDLAIGIRGWNEENQTINVE